MKKICLLAFLIFFVGSLGAQTSKRTVITNYLNDFTGTWVQQTDSCELTVVLKRGYSTNFNSDVVVGGYRYVKNGNVVVDCLDSIPLTVFVIANNSAAIIAAAFEDDIAPFPSNKMGFHFYDKLYGKEHYGFLTLLSPTQLEWRLVKEHVTVVHYIGQPKTEFIRGFSVPMKAVLTRVEE